MARKVPAHPFGYVPPVKAKRKKEVAGPYRSQSSVPKIRKEATPTEHRKTSTKPKKKRSEQTTSRGRGGHLPKPPPGTSVGGTGVDVTPVLDAARHLYEASKDQPGTTAARNFVKAEGESIGRAAKETYEQQRRGNLVSPPSANQAQAGLTVVGGVEAGPGKAAEKALAKAVSAASDTSAARSLAKKAATGLKAAPKRKVARIKSAPKRAARRVKETPQRARTAPRRAKKALSTPEGRKAVARGAGRKAVRHPVRTGVPAAAAVPIPGDPGEVNERAQAFLKGTADAFTQHPGEVATTTAHGAIGFLTAPLGIAAAGVESVKKGSPAPLGHELKTLGEGTAHMVSKLASGDPKTVEETTRKETGAIPFVPLPHLIRRAKGTKLYEDTRGTVRDTVEGKRAKTRGRRMDAAKAAAERGEHVTRRKAKKIKHPVRDTARPTAEFYVHRGIGRFIEKQRSRHYISREDARMRSGELAGRLATESVAKKLRRSKGTNQAEINHGEAIRILGKHGLPVNERSLAFVQRILAGYGPWKHGDTPVGSVLDRHAAKYILDHPELLRDKHIAAGLETLNRRSAEIGGHSPRNQFQAQIDNVINPILKEEGHTPILKAEEMVPDATVSVLRRVVPKRTDPWNRVEALNYAKDLRQVQGKSALRANKIADAIESSMDGLMKPPEHGGAEGGVSTTQAVAWTPEMEAAMVKAARREGKRLGLNEPTPYLADKFPKGLGESPAPSFKAEIPLNKIWPSRGIAAKSGNALADLESTLYNSLEVPHMRKAAVKGFSRIMDNIARPVEGKHVFTTRQAERLTNMGKVPDGTLFVRRQALRALLEEADQLTPENFSAALSREIEIGQKLSSGEQIASEIKAADQMGLKGDKVVPVDSVAMHELMGHLNGPGAVPLAVGRATNFASRAILNSPAFELSQFAQDGLPMAAALSRDVTNTPKAVASLSRMGEFPVEKQAEFMAAVGSSSGLMGVPTLKALRSDSFLNPARVAAHPKVWQATWRLVNGTYLGRFDRARAGKMRQVAAVAKIEGDFKRAEKGFRLWRSSAGNLFKDMESAVEAMKGMTPDERKFYVAQHPVLGDRLQQSMNGLGGNWNSFTVFEKNIAPFAIFYAFQRYSVLWTLYHFPLDHPVVATALAMAGEVNAQELQKLAAEHGGVPTPLDYAKPVVNGNVLPAGSRFSTVLGAPQQAVIEGKPTALLGGLPPPVTIPLEAAVGKNFYTNRELGESGWTYMLRQGGNLSPIARLFGIPDLGQSQSAGSKLFEEQDPLRTKRSVLFPFIGQTGKQYGEEKGLEALFKEKYGEGNIPSALDSTAVQKVLFGPGGKVDKGGLKRLLKTIHSQERASDKLKHKEAKFFPKGESWTDEQTEALREIEDAWQTGPGAKKKSTNPYLEALEPSTKGNVYLEALKGSGSKGNAYLKALE